ncbi:hypothetical protein C8J56DRAFT_591508 [Mycena floridula]|nr:hypothetical protein C8J56DRAFT_591508 [Mycena floridula]
MNSETMKVPGDIDFFYLDSGPPSSTVYQTFILLHGHTFHGATFQKLVEPARTRNIRLILPNRRSYPGTTPYSSEELASFLSGTPEARTQVLSKQGLYLALLVDGLIQKHKLHEGKVSVGAWSLGTPFLCAVVQAITLVDDATRRRLKDYVRSIIFWDPPSTTNGIASPPKAWTPLHAHELSVEERAVAFGIWATTYFVHPNLASRNPEDLTYRHSASPEREPTIKHITSDTYDLTAGDKGETILEDPSFQPVLLEITRSALLDPKLRDAWGYPALWTLWGTAAQWNCIYGAWKFEEISGEAGDPRFKLRSTSIEGGNHFVMWDEPEKALKGLQACLPE